MRHALEQVKLKSVYDAVAGRYDTQHTLVTARSDQRGRRLLVARAVRPGDRVLDAGGGTGSTSLLAAAAAGADGHVTLVDLSDGMLADRVESVVWRFPWLSLGCRSVEVLPALLDAGATVELDRFIGIPLWPFRVLVVRKPA